MQTSASVESASLFEIDQNRRLYEFYFGWFVKGMCAFVVLAGVLAKLAVESRFHRGTFIAAGAMSSLGLVAPLVILFGYERRTSTLFARLAALTETDPISTTPFRVLLMGGAALWLALAAVWVTLWLNVL